MTACNKNDNVSAKLFCPGQNGSNFYILFAVERQPLFGVAVLVGLGRAVMKVRENDKPIN